MKAIYGNSYQPGNIPHNKDMSKELERIKVYVQEQTAELAENVRAELLDALAVVGERGSREPNFESPDAENYLTNNAGQVCDMPRHLNIM